MLFAAGWDSYLHKCFDIPGRWTRQKRKVLLFSRRETEDALATSFAQL